DPGAPAFTGGQALKPWPLSKSHPTHIPSPSSSLERIKRTSLLGSAGHGTGLLKVWVLLDLEFTTLI
ncbi:MAG: hypothetical protein OXE74_01265, partial [Cyanobacteria bacterium MAG CAR2_bin_4]|nr:hypothetical protein [Cyanobacteria bacterium MAG CAR2_bin_4]